LSVEDFRQEIPVLVLLASTMTVSDGLAFGAVEVAALDGDGADAAEAPACPVRGPQKKC
jgi:hypothetical protein